MKQAGKLTRLVKRSPVANSIIIYAAAFAVAGATPFLLLPVLTRYLSPGEFGEVTSFLILVAVLGNMAGLSAHGFVSIRYFKSEVAKFKGIVSSAVLAVATAHLLAATIVLLLFPQLSRVIGLPIGFALLAAFCALTVSLNTIFLALYQSSGQPVLYLKARALQGGVEITLCLGLLILATPDSGARIVSYCTAMAACAALGLVYCTQKNYIGKGANKTDIRGLLSFGLPMLPHIAAGTAITYLDRAMVSSMLGVDHLGIYMVAMQIALAMMVAIEPLNKALAPWLFAQLSLNDASIKRMVVRNTYFLYLALAIIGAAIVFLSHLFFFDFIGMQYSAAKNLVGWIVLGFVFQGMYYSVVNYLFFAEKTGRLSIMSTLTAVLGAALSYLLISAYGLVGAGISFAINNAVLFLLVWIAAARAVPMPWRLSRGGHGAH